MSKNQENTGTYVQACTENTYGTKPVLLNLPFSDNLTQVNEGPSQTLKNKTLDQSSTAFN